MSGFTDPTMLDLFRQEAQAHAESLEAGLIRVEEDQTPELIEPLMRAAHSIKGAARIVGLEEAVQLAHAMEDVLVAVQAGELTLSPEAIDILMDGVDIFKRLAEEEVEYFQEWLTAQAEEIGRLIDLLNRVRAGRPAPSDKGPAGPRPEPRPGPEPEPEEAAGPIRITADPTMVGLFLSEAETHGAALAEAFAADPGQGEELEPLVRAAHSIRGAAKIVGLDIVAALAAEAEHLLGRIRSEERPPAEEELTGLRTGSELLVEMAGVPAEDLESWLMDRRAEISGLRAGLMGRPAPARPPEPGPEPEPEPPPPAPEPVSGPEPGAKGSEPEPQAIQPRARAGQESSVRVTAENLSRLMGLAGESLVQTRLLGNYRDGLYRLKGLSNQLGSTLESLSETLDPASREDSLEGLLMTQAVRQVAESRQLLVDHLEAFESFSLGWEHLAERLYGEAVATRMRPFRDGLKGFPRLVRDISRKLGKKIRLKVEGEATRVDRDILSRLEAPLNHLIRNGCDHGLEKPETRLRQNKPEEGTIRIQAGHRAGMLTINVSDDGRGIDPEKVRMMVLEKGLVTPEMAQGLSESELFEFLFLPGFTTTKRVTELSGRGVGLDVVQSMLQEVGGTVRATSKLGQGTEFQLKLPLTLSVIRTLLVEIGREVYAFPLNRVDRILSIPKEEIEVIQGRQYYHFEEANIGLLAGDQALDLIPGPSTGGNLRVVVIGDAMNRYGVVIEKIMGERDLVVRPLDPRLGKVPNISAAAILDDGSPVLIIDVEDMVRSIDKLLSRGSLDRVDRDRGGRVAARAKMILVVDDSITVREAERKMLENAGFMVDTAVDGMDGLNAIRTGKYDLIVSDVDMPRMNGIELVTTIKADEEYKDLPVIIVSYKDREEDRLLGLEAGANYYLTKSSFYDETLIEAVRDLIGEA